jgi:putative transposase
LEQILQSARLFDMAVIAYCFMPDHVHLLVEGCSDGADAIAFVHQAKQRSGYAFGRRGSDPLWQPSYYDRVLRHDDATIAVTRYIVENPVRGGLVVAPADYPFSGSTRFTMEQVLEAVCWQP